MFFYSAFFLNVTLVLGEKNGTELQWQITQQRRWQKSDYASTVSRRTMKNPNVLFLRWKCANNQTVKKSYIFFCKYLAKKKAGSEVNMLL